MGQPTSMSLRNLPRYRFLIAAVLFLCLCLLGYQQGQWGALQGGLYGTGEEGGSTSTPEPIADLLGQHIHEQDDTGEVGGDRGKGSSSSTPAKDVLAYLPKLYTDKIPDAAFCEERFGLQYLKGLAEHITSYCEASSAARTFCFHSTTEKTRVDSMCIAGPASFKQPERKWSLPCSTHNVAASPPLHSLGEYWYDTGPGYLLDNFMTVQEGDGAQRTAMAVSEHSQSDIIMLVKREGTANLWHSLMEIFAASMTMDVLHMARDHEAGGPLVDETALANARIVILDSMEQGPFWDIWGGILPGNMTRLSDADPASLASNQLILPLAGGGNPFWQGDWVVHDCHGSALLDVFVRRIFSIFGLESPPPAGESKPIKLTYIDRTNKRKLLDQDAHVKAIRERFPDIEVEIVDFAKYTIKEQVELARQTDVLVGVHGAGLTHAMFMPPGTAVVEIMPEQLQHKGFRNLAKLRGQHYFGTHGGEASAGADWHDADVTLELDKYIHLVEMAINSVYNEGLRNIDVN